MDAWRTSEAHQTILIRTADVARRRGDDHCGVDHVLSALAEAPASTPASRALSRRDAAGADASASDSTSANGMVAVTPQLQQVLAMAAGMALHAGVREVTDETVLLAVCFHAPEALTPIGLTAEAVVAALAAEGVDVPNVEPPAADQPVTWGPAIYVDEADWPAVDGMIAEHLVPRRVPVAFNVSVWQPGRLYIVAEAGTALDAMVRAAVSAPDRVSVVAYQEAMAHESDSV